MHARELIELAAILVTHSHPLLQRPPRYSAKEMESYWTNCRCRHDRWSRSLKRFDEASSAKRPEEQSAMWRDVRPVLEEILASEILARVWTALAHRYDELSGEAEFWPVAENVYLTHAEARNRALGFLVRAFPTSTESVYFNRFRRRIEHWNDVLIGGLTTCFDATAFAFDRHRAENFAADLRAEDVELASHSNWRMLRASLSAVFRTDMHGSSPNADVNRAVADSILRTLEGHYLDSIHLLPSLWLDRLNQVTRDAEGWLEQALGETRPNAVKR